MGSALYNRKKKKKKKSQGGQGAGSGICMTKDSHALNLPGGRAGCKGCIAGLHRAGCPLITVWTEEAPASLGLASFLHVSPHKPGQILLPRPPRWDPPGQGGGREAPRVQLLCTDLSLTLMMDESPDPRTRGLDCGRIMGWGRDCLLV